MTAWDPRRPGAGEGDVAELAFLEAAAGGRDLLTAEGLQPVSGAVAA